MKNREGFSLAELIVGLVVASLVSASIIQVMVVQSRFMNTQEGRANARAVSRGATNLVLSDLRMVQASGGVVMATPDSITLRVPYAIGIMCTNSGTVEAVFPPTDSLIYADGVANRAGVGWRDGAGNLTWIEGGLALPASGSISSCTLLPQPINVPTGYRVQSLAVAIPGGYPGAPVIMHQQIKYAFRNSTAQPGRIGLYRTRMALGTSEELVAPFDTASRFLFFWKDSVNANVAPPADLNDIRGIELFLVGVNERTAATTDAETAPLRTAVFFKN